MIGAGLIVTLQQYCSDRVGGWVTVIIGGIFVACVMAFRRGIVGELTAWLERRPKKRDQVGTGAGAGSILPVASNRSVASVNAAISSVARPSR